MKNDLEMFNSVLSRLELYEKQKKRKSIIVRRTVALTLGTAAVLGIGIFTHAMKPPKKPSLSQSGIIVETETTSAETTTAPTSSSTAAPQTVTTEQTTVITALTTVSSALSTTATVHTTATAARTTRNATATTVTSTAVTTQNVITTTASTMTHGDLTVSTVPFTGEITTVTTIVSTNPPQNNPKYVMITYEEIDLEAVSAETEKRADEYVKEIEEFEYTDEEIESMRQSYFDKQFSAIRKEWNKERAKSIINALGADPSKVSYAIFAPTVHCELTDKQIEAAKSLPLIISITLQENNEQKVIWIKNNE